MIKRILFTLSILLFGATTVFAFPVIDTKNIDTHFVKLEHTLALAYVAHGNIYRAIEQYETILEQDKNDVYANYYLGVIFEGLDKKQTANRYYKKALAQNPDDARIYYNYAMFLSKYNPKKSIKYFEKADELSPYEAEILYDIGVTYSEMKDNKSAIEYFKQAVKADTEFAAAHNNLCFSLALEGKFEEALPYCEKSIKLDDKSYPAYDSIGYVYAGLKQYDKAVENYENALKINNKIGEIYFHLAEALKANSSYNEAITNYQIAMTLDKTFKSKSKKGIKYCRKFIK